MMFIHDMSPLDPPTHPPAKTHQHTKPLTHNKQALLRVLTAVMDYRSPPQPQPQPSEPNTPSDSVLSVLGAAAALTAHKALQDPKAPLARALSPRQRAEVLGKGQRVAELFELLRRGEEAGGGGGGGQVGVLLEELPAPRFVG